MDNGAVLSQEAIDALLNSVPADSGDTAPAEEAAPEAAAPEPVAEEPEVNVVEAPPLHPEATATSAATPEPVAEVAPPAAAPAPAPAPAPQAATPPAQGSAAIPPAPVYQPLPPPPPMVPPPVVAQPGKGGITREEAVEIAGQAAETESAPVQAAVNRVSARVDTMEAALEKIAQLEEEIVQLKKRPEPKPDPRIIQLFDRLNELEDKAKKSPVFGLYDKFSCTSCGHVGEAQVRARCGHCAKEGWFGKKSKRDAHPKHEGEHAADEQPVETVSELDALEKDPKMLLGLDPTLGI